MPGTNMEMDANSSNDDIEILDEKKREPVKNETSISMSSNSSLSVLDENIIKQIVSVAEVAIKNHVKQQKAATQKVDTKDDDDDEIQVISETKPAPPPPKSNQTVLQLGLPKELQFKIIEQLKASGKSAAQIDLHNLFSEVFSKTMKKMNGLEVSNCSLRFTSNGKRKQNSDTLGTSTAKSEGTSDSTQDEAVPNKKHRTTLNNNKTIQSSGEKLLNGGHTSSQQTGSGSENNGFIVENNDDLDNQSTSKSKRRPVGRPPKYPKSPIIKNLKPKQPKEAQRCSKRLHDHSMKDWPYHAPLPPVEDLKKDEPKKEEPKKKKRRMGPHRESTKVKSLRKIPSLTMQKDGQLYVSINLFTHLFVNFKMDTGCLMSFLVTLFGDPGKDFVFKKWQITHLSLRAAQAIVNVMKKPLFLVSIFDQLQTLPTVPLKKVSYDTYKKTHLTQLSTNEFCNLFALGPTTPTRISMRTKMPTQKFQDSPCITQMTSLSSSITSPPKKSPNSSSTISCVSKHVQTCPQTKEEILSNIDRSWISGKLRPKYRKLLHRKKEKLPETPEEKICEIEADNFSHLAEVAADEDEIIIFDEEEPPTITPNFMENNSKLEEKLGISTNCLLSKNELKSEDLDNNPLNKSGDFSGINEADFERLDIDDQDLSFTIPVLNSRVAVRKFPSYGWNREREARIKIEMNKQTANESSTTPVIPAKKVSCRNLPDFPPFQLSGLVETAPKEVEGWFTSKVKLLRQLSEASGQLTTTTKSSSPNSSRNGSAQKKVQTSGATKKSSKGKVPVKVFLDNEVETCVDLLEYKQNLEQINSIIEEIEEIESKSIPNEPENTDFQVINEALRVAKKIEKISIAGLGRQVSLPSPQSFLPPGWHCRKTGNGKVGSNSTSGWEYVNNDGYKVKSIQAAIKHEAEIRSASHAAPTTPTPTTTPSSTTSELLDTSVP